MLCNIATIDCICATMIIIDYCKVLQNVLACVLLIMAMDREIKPVGPNRRRMKMPPSVQFTLMMGLLALVTTTAKISLRLMAGLDSETQKAQAPVAESEREIRR